MLRLLKLFLYFSLSTFALTLLYFSLIEIPYRPVSVTSTPERYLLPKVIAHKAKHQNYPSNSLEGINALMSEGIRGIEIDIQSSRDGVPIVFHALDLSEGSTGNGAVSDLLFSEIEKLYLTKDGQASFARIPSLEQVLKQYCKKMTIVLDVKSFSIFDQSTTEKAVSLVQQYQCQSSVIFDSINPAVLLKVRKLDPQIPVSLSFLEDIKASAEETQAQLNKIPAPLRWRVVQNILRAIILPDYLSPRFSISIDRIKLLTKLGYPLISWTVDDITLANEMFGSGVQSILSNRATAIHSEIRQVSVDDASRLNSAMVRNVIKVRNTEEIQVALKYARSKNLKVAIAGKRHSMGGQTIIPDGIVIDMNSMNEINFDTVSNLVKVQAGASWKDVQDLLDLHGRSVKVMQSDNNFSIGGSISVNVHGWQPNSAPLSATIKNFELILADGSVLTCERPFADVCRAAIGGYGLFGVISEATLETTENVPLKQSSSYIPSDYLVAELLRHLHQPHLELLYARLRVDDKEFLNEAGVHAYYSIGSHKGTLPKIEPEALVRTKRAVFRLSERSDNGKKIRWFAEKELLESLNKKLQLSTLTRNQIMYSDFQFIWPADFSKHDILHEYFIPIDNSQKFIEELRLITKKYNQNLLNVTVRHILPDSDSLLPYAKQEVLSFVLLFSQEEGPEADFAMQAYTQELIDAVLKLEGSFYLPYRRHYTSEQLITAYPRLKQFLDIKRVVDPGLTFQNMLWKTLNQAAH